MATKKHNPRTAQSFDAVLGTRIRAARNQCSMSQQELGAKLGVSFQQIQKYEQGRNRVSCVAIIKIAEALSQPISYFLDEAPFKPNSKAEELAKGIIYLTPNNSSGSYLLMQRAIPPQPRGGCYAR